MKKIVFPLLAICLVSLSSCKDEAKKVQEAEEVVVEETKKVLSAKPQVDAQVSFALESRSGSSAVGKVSFVQVGEKVTFEANVFGLEPGTHAIHIHEKADCSSEDGKSTGGHWNPTFTAHGKWGEGEYHKGDIGNFVADAKGEGKISLETDEWCIGCPDDKKNILGKAIIVHQGTDDFTSQPSGAAGARVSCGGIIR